MKKRITLLVILTAVLAMAMPASAESVLTLNTNSAELCPCSTARIIGTVESVAGGTYALASDSSWATIAPSSLALGAGEAKNVYIYITPDCFTEPGARKIKINADSASATVDVNVLECHGVSVSSDVPRKTACLDEEAAFDISVKNTGKTEESFALSSDYGTLEPKEVTLGAGEAKSARLSATAKSSLEKITITAASLLSYAKKSATVELAGETCYAQELAIAPAKATACQGLPAKYTITLKNTGTHSDTYSLSNEFGRVWSRSISLQAGEEEAITLEVPTENESVGEHKFYINLESAARADMKVSKEAVLLVENCYSVELSAEQDTMKVCPGVPAKYELSVSNTGKLPDSYTISAESGSPSEGYLSLGAGETKGLSVLFETSFNESRGREMTAMAASKKANATAVLNLEFDSFDACYDFKIFAEPETITLKNQSTGLFTVKLKNTGKEPMAFVLKSEKPEWAYMDPTELEIAPQETKDVYIYVAPTYGTPEGEYPVKLVATSNSRMSKTVQIYAVVGNKTAVLGEIKINASTPTGKVISAESQKKIFYAIIIGMVAIVAIIFLPDILGGKKKKAPEEIGEIEPDISGIKKELGIDATATLEPAKEEAEIKEEKAPEEPQKVPKKRKAGRPKKKRGEEEAAPESDFDEIV